MRDAATIRRRLYRSGLSVAVVWIAVTLALLARDIADGEVAERAAWLRLALAFVPLAGLVIGRWWWRWLISP